MATKKFKTAKFETSVLKNPSIQGIRISAAPTGSKTMNLVFSRKTKGGLEKPQENHSWMLGEITIESPEQLSEAKQNVNACQF